MYQFYNNILKITITIIKTFLCNCGPSNRWILLINDICRKFVFIFSDFSSNLAYTHTITNLNTRFHLIIHQLKYRIFGILTGDVQSELKASWKKVLQDFLANAINLQLHYISIFSLYERIIYFKRQGNGCLIIWHLASKSII